VRILRVAAAAIAGPRRGGSAAGGRVASRRATSRGRGATAAALAEAWSPGHPAAATRALEAALILCADHELNVSTFAARCAASAEATPWDAVAAGLATLRGRRHGGGSLRAEALLREAEASSPTAAVSERLRRGEPLPGFGHRLYPAGDPRGAELLAIAARLAPRSKWVTAAHRLTEAVVDLLGDRPNLDLGLAVLCAALRLPPGSSIALFALGRTVGWVAHAREEYARERLIRPRARYVGPQPAS
jgi:citrate synthase